MTFDLSNPTVDRLEERCESFKKESTDLHNRNVELVKKHQILKEVSTRQRADSRTKLAEESAGSPAMERAPGFQDFMSPQKDERKKRQLPIAPRRRPRAESAEDGTYMALIKWLYFSISGYILTMASARFYMYMYLYKL